MAQNNISIIVDDLKTSWYFRIWTALWAICAIFTFIALIVLSHSSEKARAQPGWKIWIERRESDNFPQVILTLLPSENATDSITATRCFFNGDVSNVVGDTNCENGAPANQCRLINSASFVSLRVDESYNFPFKRTDFITCDVETQLSVNGTNGMLAFAIANDVRPNPHLIFPGTYSNVRMEKEMFKPRKQNEETHFRTQLEYISSVKEKFWTFSVSFEFAHLHVTHFDEQDLFNGWMGVGEIGGFAFFLYIFHTALMFFIGFCVPNTSKFLGGQSDGGYQTLGH